MYDPTYDPRYEDHKGDYQHPKEFIEKNEEIFKDLLKQNSLDSAFMDNIDMYLKGDIDELSKHSKALTQYQFENPHLELEENKVLNVPLPSKFNNSNTMPSKIMFNRPWIVKMRTNDSGFPTLECFAIDDDGDIMQVNGHPVPPLPNDPPKNEWKPLNQSLKLCEVPPIPKCPKHKHLQEPPQFELVRETMLQATIFKRNVNIE